MFTIITIISIIVLIIVIIISSSSIWYRPHLQVTRYQCADARTSEILEQIIQETI